MNQPPNARPRLRRTLRLLAAVATAALLLGPATATAAYRFDRPQVKINWIDVSRAPTVRIHVSFLDRRLRPVPLKELRTIEVLRHGKDGGRGDLVKKFTDLMPEDGLGEVVLFSKAAEPRDVVIVAAGHQHPELRDGDLGANQRESLGIFFKKLGATDRVNVIWYHDRLLTYVNRQGKANELSDLADNVPYCREKVLETYEWWGQEPPEPEKEGEEPPGSDPCGLLTDFGRLEKILKGMPYQGFYPRLMGFQSLARELCIHPEHEPIGKAGPGSDKAEQVYGGAIDEAMKLLVQKGQSGRPKYLLLLSDGKDGYLSAQDDCRLKYLQDVKTTIEEYRESCAAQGGSWLAKSACLKEIDIQGKTKQLKKQAEVKLDQRVVADQQRFRDQRLGPWLALARAANVAVYAVGYPLGFPSERERLEILAYKTGGTYREVTEATELGDAYSDLVDELANQYVIVFDAGLQSRDEAAFSVKLAVAGVGSFQTAPYGVQAPEIPAGFAALKRSGQDKLRWLEAKVGSPWHIVIVVAACLLAALFVFLFIKLLIALVKKIFGKGAKMAKGAAKKAGGAAKGAAGAAQKMPAGVVRK
jgi:hypothetical protein